MPETGRSVSVHPHVHGELLTSYLPIVVLVGSSPRAWGTPCRSIRSLGCSRFIPTCMGNSLRNGSILGSLTVHPHVHGELCFSRAFTFAVCGSSPRAWGTRKDLYRDGRPDRFIPTCMGNSRLLLSDIRHRAVHPHVHGELNMRRNITRVSRGSSPRAWGTPALPAQRPGEARFIPTCMGNSGSRS